MISFVISQVHTDYLMMLKRLQGNLQGFRNYQMSCLTPSMLHAHTQLFYGPFSRVTRVSRCQKRTSGLYGARED